MTGTRYFSTDTDAIRHGERAPLGTRGQRFCGSCGQAIGLLDMWCPCQEAGQASGRSTGAEQTRNSLALAGR